MPYEQVRFETGTCEYPPIVVDRPIVNIPPNASLRIHIGLDSNTDATMQFFSLQGGKASPIGGFCEDVSGVNLPLPGTGAPTDCIPTTHGSFAYTVTASNHQDLDPVLIIEPNVSNLLPGKPMFDAPTFNPVILGITLLIGLVVGGLLGRRRT